MPKATTAHTYHADGAMRFDSPKGTDAYYEPNSFGGPVQDDTVKEPPLRIDGNADRYNHREGNDDYTQAADLFRLFTAEEKSRLFGNIAAAMQGVPDEIIARQLEHFRRCDPAYADGIIKARATAHTPAASSPPSAAPAP